VLRGVRVVRNVILLGLRLERGSCCKDFYIVRFTC
jgi:hypothetical protein